jgi:5-methyltetrahydropteroyltriglutamate--homocysteine methyltransferase
MLIPTEPIGSVPRPQVLIDGVSSFKLGRIKQQELDSLYDSAVRDTIQLFEATGSPVITDGEQTKSSFATYPIDGLENLASDGVIIPFADGHTRQLPRLTAGPFHYVTYADRYLEKAQQYAKVPVKQAVISASALSLLYPGEAIDGYSKEAFIQDLLREHETDIRRCLAKGAYSVQIDFTEGRLSVKLDPTRQLLKPSSH